MTEETAGDGKGGRRAWAFYRHSTAGPGMSIESQREACRSWAAQNGYEIVEEFVATCPGTTVEQDEAFRSMMVKAQAGRHEASCLLVSYFSRLGRTAASVKALKAALAKVGVRIRAVAELPFWNRKVVQRIFGMAARGYDSQRIANTLNQEGA